MSDETEDAKALREQIEQAEQRQAAAEKQFKRLHTICITAQQVPHVLGILPHYRQSRARAHV